MERIKSFNEHKPLFYLVATPIGNLQDISLRALQILKEADFVAAEDTRNAAKLLANYDISKPLISLHEHNEVSASNDVLNRVLAGQKGVFMSDAGYPGISDPGQKLTEILIKNNIAVSVISGPAAFLSGLVASGLATNHFYFHGFLPAKKSARIKELEQLQTKTETLIFYEAPHRISETLSDLVAVFGERKAVIGRELTKIHEEYLRGTLFELSEIPSSTLKGEMVIVVSGAPETVRKELNIEQLIDTVQQLVELGLSTKDAIQFVAHKEKISKNQLSDLYYSKQE